MLQLDFAQISLLSIVSLRPHVRWMSVSVLRSIFQLAWKMWVLWSVFVWPPTQKHYNWAWLRQCSCLALFCGHGSGEWVCWFWELYIFLFSFREKCGLCNDLCLSGQLYQKLYCRALLRLLTGAALQPCVRWVSALGPRSMYFFSTCVRNVSIVMICVWPAVSKTLQLGLTQTSLLVLSSASLWPCIRWVNVLVARSVYISFQLAWKIASI